MSICLRVIYTYIVSVNELLQVDVCIVCYAVSVSVHLQVKEDIVCIINILHACTCMYHIHIYIHVCASTQCVPCN